MEGERRSEEDTSRAEKNGDWREWNEEEGRMTRKGKRRWVEEEEEEEEPDKERRVLEEQVEKRGTETMKDRRR